LNNNAGGCGHYLSLLPLALVDISIHVISLSWKKTAISLLQVSD